MKKINVYFEDEEMDDLKEVKGKATWHNFIMTLTNNKSCKKEDEKNEK